MVINNPKADGIIGTAKVHLHLYPKLKDLTVALAIDYYRQAFRPEQQMIDMQTSTNTFWHN